MVQKRLKRSDRKIASQKEPENAVKKTVLVGTYKGDQLKSWPGFYNYPISPKDKIDIESAKRVNELWLFQGAKAGHFFAAEYVGQFTRTELKERFAYPAKGEGHGNTYLLYRTTETEIYDPETGLAEAVIVRSSDFATAPKVRKQIKAYLESPDRKDPIVSNLVPKILTKLPKEVLRVCEEAVQLDFLITFDTQRSLDIRKNMISNANEQNRDNRLTCLDFFSGSGLVSIGLSEEFNTVWANDISTKKARVFNANNAKDILQVCPIENVQGANLPKVDLSWGSFPCQDLSLAGDMEGLYAKRSGLFWQWLRVMDEMDVRPPVVVAENVVGLVSAQGGKFYVKAHNELVNRGYRVGSVMVDAAHWLPQSRKRIFVIGVREDVDVSDLIDNKPSWCHPLPVVNVAKKIEHWTWWKIPKPQETRISLDDVIEFESPCDAEEERTYKLSLIAPETMEKIRNLANASRRVFTGYRRTRNHKQVLEIRTDGIAGCLRTPCGGSSRQIVLIADKGQLNTRLLTVRETARLMGAPDSYQIPGSYNDGYMAMGDAVAVPVVQFLSKHLLAPLAHRVK